MSVALPEAGIYVSLSERAELRRTVMRRRAFGLRAFGLLVSGLLLIGTAVTLGSGTSGAAVPPAPYNGPPSTIGTNFWTAFGINNSTPTTDYIDLSGSTATTATVAVPGGSFSQDVSVTPGHVTAVAVTGADLSDADGTQDLGVHVTAAAPITVYGLEDLDFSTDGFTALPTTAIGTQYYALGYDNTVSPGAQPSDFQVVGTQDGTTVTITPSNNTASRTAGTPYTVTLNAGQVYELLGTTGLDLTGTKISASAPVSVLAGAQCTNIPSLNYVACNYVAEQMPPTNEWGTDFVTEPLATRTMGDTFRMLASENGTTVSIDGATVATLNAGKFYQAQLTAASVIHSNRPILVAQYSDSESYDNVANSDPSETLIPPDEQFLNSYTLATAPDSRFTNYLNVVAPTTEVGSVILDGSPIPAGHFSPISTSGFSGAKIQVATGVHTLSGPQAFGLTSYGFGSADAYSEPGGYGAGQVANVAFLTLSPSDQFPATGQQACVTATVEDLNHNPLAGIGVSFTVTGTNPTNGFASTQSNGQATFCYTGDKAGADLVTATSGSLNATATVDYGGTPGHNAIGYRLQGKDGGVFDYGKSQFYGSLPGIQVSAPIVATANTYDNGGYWLAGTDGSVFAFGDANYHGGMYGLPLNAPIVGIAATPDQGGYWLVASDGGVFAFGDAQYYGSMGGVPLNKPIVGIAASPTGKGYWLVASDGGIFSFGDAGFHGSMGGTALNKPVVGMWPTNDGNGYWLVASDGGVFAIGDAGFFGSAGNITLNKPVVGIVADPSNGGYWLMATDGGVFSYGNAPFLGAASSSPPSPLYEPITSAST
jgi:IgGFc binding protein/Bacterial Ig-like domain (group 1)